MKEYKSIFNESAPKPKFGKKLREAVFVHGGHDNILNSARNNRLQEDGDNSADFITFILSPEHVQIASILKKLPREIGGETANEYYGDVNKIPDEHVNALHPKLQQLISNMKDESVGVTICIENGRYKVELTE